MTHDFKAALNALNSAMKDYMRPETRIILIAEHAAVIEAALTTQLTAENARSLLRRARDRMRQDGSFIHGVDDFGNSLILEINEYLGENTPACEGETYADEIEEKLSYLHGCYRNQRPPTYDLVTWFEEKLRGISNSRNKYDLKEMLDKITPENKHDFIDENNQVTVVVARKSSSSELEKYQNSNNWREIHFERDEFTDTYTFQFTNNSGDE
jgi:hypothetical protein